MFTVTFAVTPSDDAPRSFEAFVMDVPMPNGYEPARDRAARRAYFSAMAHLSTNYGIDVDGFQVNEWDEAQGFGRRVGPGGFMH